MRDWTTCACRICKKLEVSGKETKNIFWGRNIKWHVFEQEEPPILSELNSDLQACTCFENVLIYLFMFSIKGILLYKLLLYKFLLYKLLLHFYDCTWSMGLIKIQDLTRIQNVPHKKSLIERKVAMPAIESLSTASDVPLINQLRYKHKTQAKETKKQTYYLSAEISCRYPVAIC